MSTERVFQAGHSLGGIVLETWAKDNADLSVGILLFGSYLPNGFFGNGDTNVFPVPVLTAMGSLDGGALSYITREAIEAEDPQLEGKYPVLVIANVNHGQVASGVIPDTVIENDIDAEVDNEEAFRRYAGAAVSFMVTSRGGESEFSTEIVEEQSEILETLKSYTKDFLVPFNNMRVLELDLDRSPWIDQAQKIISGSSDVSKLLVTNELVQWSDLGAKPSITTGDDCSATIGTYGRIMVTYVT